MSLKDMHKKKWAFCIDAGEYQGVSLFAPKMYEYIPDPISEAEGFLRVIDEEDEPYYYDSKAFVKTKSASNGLLIPFLKSKSPKKRQAVTKNGRR
jgi:hypothetical protein